MKKANYGIPFKKTGTILNFLFIINWIFLLMFFLDAKRYQKSLTGGYFIAALAIPIVTLLFLSLYFLIIWSISKNYHQKQQKQKIILYSILIIGFAILSILSTLLILITRNSKLLILGFSLSIVFSIVFGIIAIIFDTYFMVTRIKWDHMLLENNQKEDIIDIVNDGDVINEIK